MLATALVDCCVTSLLSVQTKDRFRGAGRLGIEARWRAPCPWFGERIIEVQLLTSNQHYEPDVTCRLNATLLMLHVAEQPTTTTPGESFPLRHLLRRRIQSPRLVALIVVQQYSLL